MKHNPLSYIRPDTLARVIAEIEFDHSTLDPDTGNNVFFSDESAAACREFVRVLYAEVGDYIADSLLEQATAQVEQEA